MFVEQKRDTKKDSSFEYQTIEFVYKGQNSQYIALDESLNINSSIIMYLKQHQTVLRHLNPSVAFKFNERDGRKLVKIVISGERIPTLTREFTTLHENFQNLQVAQQLLPATSPNTVQEYYLLQNQRPNRHLFRSLDRQALNQECSLKVEVTLKIPLQSGIKRDFESLINNSKLSDYTIKVGGRDFFVHKAILAARSPVFFTKFTSEFQDSKSKTGTVSEVSHVSHEAFLDFLHFLYTDEVTDMNSHVIELLSASDFYDVADLKIICESHLQNGLTEDNAADIFQYAHLYRCAKSLKMAAFKLIQSLFAKNILTIPDALVDSPAEVKRLVIMRDQLVKTLK